MLTEEVQPLQKGSAYAVALLSYKIIDEGPLSKGLYQSPSACFGSEHSLGGPASHNGGHD